MRFRCGSKRLKLGLSAAVLSLAAWPDIPPALADCAPAAADGVSVICSGDTVNQNDPNGFGTGAEEGVTLEVLSGASVTGTGDGITLGRNATIDNAGSVTGGAGGVGIGGGDAIGLRVTNRGTISGGDFGVVSPDISSVINAGSITGGDAGVAAEGLSSVINTGSITGGNDGVAGGSGNVTNSGSISGGTNGISAIDGLSVINSGSITGGTNGFLGSGSNLSVINSGRITGGDGGIFVGGDVSVINSGSISGGNNSGIAVSGDLRLGNSGRISGGDTGILAGTITSLTNAGTIVGGAGGAIREDGAGDTRLTLLPGSVIVGTIDLGGGVNTLDVRGGLNLATTFETAAPLIGDSNGVPFLVNGSQVIVVDPTGFAAAEVWLDSFANSILNTVDTKAGSGRGRAGSRAADGGGAGGSVSEAQADPAGPEPGEQRQGVWGSVFGGLSNQEADGALADLDTAYGGALLGIDALRRGGLVLGGFLGGALGTQEVQADTQDIDTASAFAGLYLRHDWSAYWVNLTLAGGWVGQDSERKVANNLAPGGIEEAEADSDGFFAIPAATLGTRLVEILPGLSLEPSLRLHYAGLFLDGYEESGSAADLRVESRELHQLGGRVQLALPYVVQAAEGARLRVEARLGIDGRLDLGDDRIDARVAGVPLDFSASFDDEVATGFLGFGASWASADGSTVFSGGTELRAGSDGARGLAGQLAAELRFNF